MIKSEESLPMNHINFLKYQDETVVKLPSFMIKADRTINFNESRIIILKSHFIIISQGCKNDTMELFTVTNLYDILKDRRCTFVSIYRVQMYLNLKSEIPLWRCCFSRQIRLSEV